jgi:hypothetical protein
MICAGKPGMEQETGKRDQMSASVHHERPGRRWRGDEEWMKKRVYGPGKKRQMEKKNSIGIVFIYIQCQLLNNTNMQSNDWSPSAKRGHLEINLY